jgi:hypothetical protein
LKYQKELKEDIAFYKKMAERARIKLEELRNATEKADELLNTIVEVPAVSNASDT